MTIGRSSMKLGRPGTVALVSDGTSFSGAERYLAALVESLTERRFIALLPVLEDDVLAKRLSSAGVDVHEVPGLGRLPDPRAIRGAQRLLALARPEVVHVNCTDQRDLGPIVAAAASRVPTVATVHLILPQNGTWREGLATRSLRRMNRLIAVSEAVGSYLGGRGLGVSVIANGLPEAQPAPDARARLGLGVHDFVIGGIGRLDVQKGWDVLCRAAALMRRDYPAAVFVVLGAGPERAALAASAHCANVRFLGHQPDAATLVSAFDVLAMPSRYEGMPLVAIEAMHAGVPVVGTRIGGVRELLSDAGVLVGVDDADALAAALIELAGDPARRRRMGVAGQRRAAEAFSAERMSAQTAAIYDDLAARR